MAKNNAKMYDTNAMVQAGMDPKTGLPVRMAETRCGLKEEIRKTLRIVDEQNAVNRYTWFNTPKGLDAQLIERILFYRGSGMLFMLQGKFYFLPYTLCAPEGSTGIDCYGRFTGVTPLPFNGTANDGDPESPWIRGKVFKPIYEPIDLADYEGMSPEELQHEIENMCVLFHDYTPQLSQKILPRQQLNEPILDVMSDCIPFMRSALLNSTGVMGVKVANEDEQAEVDRMSNALNICALTGRKYTGVVGSLDFQELTGGNVAKAEEFMLALQSLDNFRLSLYGLGEGGVFEKKSHMLAAEQEMNAGTTGLVLEDGLRNRQYSSTIANSIWGSLLWCEPSECTMGLDRDGDMVAGNDGEASQAMKQSSAEDTNDE